MSDTNSKAKLPSGPWDAQGARVYFANREGGFDVYACPSSGNVAAICAEAGTVFHETGIGPRALADELKVALSRVQQLQTEHDAATATNSALSTRVRELEAALPTAHELQRAVDTMGSIIKNPSGHDRWLEDLVPIRNWLRALLPQVPTNVGGGK